MIIYKTTNLINGKFYVGKDSKNNPKYLGSGLLLKHAIKKHGKENFKKEILETCSSIEELDKAERFWIDMLFAIKDGYNIAEGGSGGNTRAGMTEDEVKAWLDKKSKAQTGKVGYWSGKKRPEHAKKLSKPRPEASEWMSKPKSEEWKKAISEGKKGKAYKRVECPHCSKVGGENNMYRWHFDKCKKKE